MRRFAATWIVLALAAALGAVAWWVQKRPPASDETAARQLLALTPSTVEGLVIERPAEKPIILARDGAGDDAGWKLTAPLTWPADMGAVISMLDALQNLVAEARFDQPEALTAYGLSPPAFTVTVRAADKESRLLFGRPTPVGNGRYAKLADDPAVFTLPAAVADRFDLQLTDLRDKQILSTRAEDVQQVRLSPQGRPAIVLARRDQGWRLVEPSPAEADASRAEDLVWTLASLYAAEFVDEPGDLARYGLDRPALRVQVTAGGSGEGKTETLAVGRVAGRGGGPASFYLRRGTERTVFRVDSDLNELLALSPERLRAPAGAPAPQAKE